MGVPSLHPNVHHHTSWFRKEHGIIHILEHQGGASVACGALVFHAPDDAAIIQFIAHRLLRIQIDNQGTILEAEVGPLPDIPFQLRHKSHPFHLESLFFHPFFDAHIKRMGQKEEGGQQKHEQKQVPNGLHISESPFPISYLCGSGTKRCVPS